MTNIREFLGLAYYTSNLDDFLAEFDKTHHKMSLSQRKEIEKYNRIYGLRDNPAQNEGKETFWDKF
jgi:hypothetical protein